MALVFDPVGMKGWTSGVVSVLDNSIAGCAKRFDSKAKELVVGHVWEGSAAKENYKNLQEAHNNFIKMMNSFGDAYAEGMNKAREAIENLEITNLGTSTNVGSMGTVDFAAMAEMEEASTNTDRVVYDYDTITGIASDLKAIKDDLEQACTDLLTKLGELGSDDNWNGEAANSAKEAMEDAIKSCKPDLMASLELCITNVDTAAKNAASADTPYTAA